jgi:hypothetical protein
MLGVRLEGCFGQGIEWDAPLGLDFGLGLWTHASHYARPKAPNEKVPQIVHN